MLSAFIRSRVVDKGLSKSAPRSVIAGADWLELELVAVWPQSCSEESITWRERVFARGIHRCAGVARYRERASFYLHLIVARLGMRRGV